MNNTTNNTAPQSLKRALALFDLLAMNQPMSVMEISKALDVTRTTVYSLLAPLIETNYIEKDEASGKYRLGYRFFEVGRQYRHYYPFIPAVEAGAKKLSQKVDCKVNAMVLKPKGIALIITSIDMSQNTMPDLDSTVPVSVSACGKVLLSALSDDELEETLKTMSFVRITDRSITNADKLRAEILQVRANGYATEYGELFAFWGCIAAPIRSVGGKIVAAMSVACPLEKMDRERDYLLKELLDTSAQVSMVLGWNGYLS